MQADVASFDTTLKVCSSGTIVVVDMQKCNPGSRGWCLYEWNHTVMHHSIEALQFVGMSERDRRRIVDEIDVDRAQCFDANDLQMILGEIKKYYGSSEAFNTRLKLLLKLQPLSYKVDLKQLATRSKGTMWDFGAVKTWLRPTSSASAPITFDYAPAAPSASESLREALSVQTYTSSSVASAAAPSNAALKLPRVLCILSGAGTGKSSISAAIVSDLLRPAWDYTNGDALLRDYLGLPTSLTAVHFLKQTDRRRQDPVSIIKSLCFQLAQQLPGLPQRLFDLGAQLDQLHSMDECCNMLLPLVVDAANGRDTVILIDALDEADPPEQLRPDWDASKGIQCLGNKALRLFLAFFA